MLVVGLLALDESNRWWGDRNLQTLNARTIVRKCVKCGHLRDVLTDFAISCPVQPWPTALVPPLYIPGATADDRARARDARNDILGLAFGDFTDFSTFRASHVPFPQTCTRCTRATAILRHAAAELKHRVPTDARTISQTVGLCRYCRTPLTGSRWRVFLYEDGTLAPGAYCLPHGREVYAKCAATPPRYRERTATKFIVSRERYNQ